MNGVWCCVGVLETHAWNWKTEAPINDTPFPPVAHTPLLLGGGHPNCRRHTTTSCICRRKNDFNDDFLENRCMTLQNGHDKSGSWTMEVVYTVHGNCHNCLFPMLEIGDTWRGSRRTHCYSNRMCEKIYVTLKHTPYANVRQASYFWVKTDSLLSSSKLCVLQSTLLNRRLAHQYLCTT